MSGRLSLLRSLLALKDSGDSEVHMSMVLRYHPKQLHQSLFGLSCAHMMLQRFIAMMINPLTCELFQ